MASLSPSLLSSPYKPEESARALRRAWTLLGALCFYICFSLVLLRVFPPPLPDEMYFAPAAHSLFEHGELRTPVIAGLERRTFWMPPAYYLALGIFFQVFGYGFESLRIFSILCGSVVVALTYILGRQLRLPFPILALVLLLTVVDPFFLRYSKLGRMDSFTLVWMMSALVAHLAWLRDLKKRWNGATLLLGALAVASHPIGIVAPVGLFLHRLMLYRHRAISRLSLWAPVFSVAFVGLALALYWARDPQEFLAQMSFQFSRKFERGVAQSIYNWAIRYRTLLFLLGPLAISIVFSVRKMFAENWSTREVPVVIFTVLTCSVSILSFELFYVLYYVPVVALTIGLAFVTSIKDWAPRFRQLARLLVFGAIANALLFDGYFSYLYLVELKNATVVSRVAREVEQSIPAQSNVLLLGAPNLYWDLRKIRHDLSFFDPFAINSARERQMLEEINVVVATRAFRSDYDEYITMQTQRLLEAFFREGKTLKLVAAFGSERPFAYRGSVFIVEPIH